MDFALQELSWITCGTKWLTHWPGSDLKLRLNSAAPTTTLPLLQGQIRICASHFLSSSQWAHLEDVALELVAGPGSFGCAPRTESVQIHVSLHFNSSLLTSNIPPRWFFSCHYTFYSCKKNSSTRWPWKASKGQNNTHSSAFFTRSLQTRQKQDLNALRLCAWITTYDGQATEGPGVQAGIMCGSSSQCPSTSDCSDALSLVYKWGSAVTWCSHETLLTECRPFLSCYIYAERRRHPRVKQPCTRISK